jgi:cytochrome P450
MSKVPPLVPGQSVPLLLHREYPEILGSGVAYLDLWPIASPMLAVFHPDVMAQFTQETSRPKHDLMKAELGPFTQCKDLVCSEGQTWKTWRSIFNPGFSAKNLQFFVPEMLEEVLVFKDWLSELAKSGKVAPLEEQTSKLTTDVIGRAVLYGSVFFLLVFFLHLTNDVNRGTRLHTQTKGHPLFDALKDQIGWLVYDNSPQNVAKMLNPLRYFKLWNNNRIMRNSILPHIRRAISEYGKEKGMKTINSLAIKAYLTDVKPTTSVEHLDADFVDTAIAQLKTFIFAGSDTTASALCFAYHFLHQHPKAMEKIRAEHDAVFGLDASKVSHAIVESPALLNQLPFTSAVIKEVLRLNPPVGSIRSGSPDFFLTHPDNNIKYPTDGMMLFSCSVAGHRNPAFWPQPDDFVPERWLAKEGDPLHARKNAFRPFELGPRNCIGQELAQLELKAILALTIREFDIESVFEHPELKVLGEVGYQVTPPGEITAHPREGMPIRVRFRLSA